MKLFRAFCIVTAALCTAYPAHAQSGKQETEPSFKWLRTVQGQSLRPYSGGFAAFYEAGKWGYEDLAGNVAIPASFEEAGDFSNGLAIVRKDGKWGVIDPSGKAVFECIYDTIAPFHDRTALAMIGKTSYYLYSNGKSRSLPSDLKFYSYNNGIAKVMQHTRKGDLYGYINEKGFFIIEPMFEEASDFFGERAFVTLRGKHFSINSKGKRKLLDFPFNSANTYLSGTVGSGFIKQGDKYIFVKYDKGRYSLQPARFDKVSEFKEGVALVRTEKGKLMYLNPDGTRALTLPDICTAAGDFSEGKAWVCMNGKYGYIDKKGTIVIDTIFSYTSDFSNGIAYVAYGGRQGVIREAARYEKYPDLRIESITLADVNGNSTVESGERFRLEVLLRNHGDDPVNGIDVVLTGKSGQSAWFSYESNQQRVASLAPDESTVVTFEGEANMDLVSEDILVNFKAQADNQFLATTSSLTFPSMGINQCKPLLASYWIHTPDHSAMAPGKNAVIEFSVVNEGTDIAKDIAVEMKWPDGITSSSSVLRLGDINPDETRTFTHTFAMDTTVSPAGQLSIVATLTDYTKKHTDVKYLMFETGRMNMEVNLLSGTSYTGAMPPAYYAQAPDMSLTTAAETPAEQTATVTASDSELLSGLTQIKTPDRNKYALIIGNEDYNSFKQQTLYEPNVDFAVSDAEAFSEYAKNIIGVPESNIVLLRNATYSQMNLNINKIARIASLSPGQVELYVYYAGHGQVDGTTKESYLIPVDVSTTAPSEGIKLEKLYATLSESGCRRAMVFLDACYSGVGRGIIIQPKATPVKGNLVVMTASSATQRSMPYQEKGHGMFTYFLLKQLKDSYGDITIEDLFKSVKQEVQSNSIWINNMEQTPELLSGPGIDNGWEDWKL